MKQWWGIMPRMSMKLGDDNVGNEKVNGIMSRNRRRQSNGKVEENYAKEVAEAGQWESRGKLCQGKVMKI